MEVKPGYKQTEVGVIPEEWEVKRLAEIATIATGNTPPTSDASNYGDEFLFVGPVDMGETKFVTATEKKLSRKGYAMSRRFPKDSILFVCIGSTIGKCGIASVELTSNQQINAIFPSPAFSVDYLFYAVSTAAPKVRAQAGEQAVPIVNKSQFAETKVQLPPLREQCAIAGALSDVDALLGGLDRLIAKKRDLKQAAMQQLLTGQTRLPGYHAEWQLKRLGDCLLSRPEYGINAPAVPFSDKLPSYIRITDISEDGRFCPDPLVSVQAASADQYYLRQGDVLFARTGASVGKSYQYQPRDGELVFAGFLIRVRPNPDLLVPAFLAAYATTKPYWNWVRLMSMRSGQPGINGNEYAQLPLLLPPFPEQTAIAAVLTDMDAELAALEQRRAKTRALKQGMMQELLTGRTRLVAGAAVQHAELKP